MFFLVIFSFPERYSKARGKSQSERSNERSAGNSEVHELDLFSLA